MYDGGGGSGGGLFSPAVENNFTNVNFDNHLKRSNGRNRREGAKKKKKKLTTGKAREHITRKLDPFYFCSLFKRNYLHVH